MSVLRPTKVISHGRLVMASRRASGSVSYTHLDVYKRQMHASMLVPERFQYYSESNAGWFVTIPALSTRTSPGILKSRMRALWRYAGKRLMPLPKS